MSLLQVKTQRANEINDWLSRHNLWSGVFGDAYTELIEIMERCQSDGKLLALKESRAAKELPPATPDPLVERSGIVERERTLGMIDEVRCNQRKLMPETINIRLRILADMYCASAKGSTDE